MRTENNLCVIKTIDFFLNIVLEIKDDDAKKEKDHKNFGHALTKIKGRRTEFMSALNDFKELENDLNR